MTDREPSVQPEPVRSVGGSRAARHHILVVEDDFAIRDVYEEVLRGAGHQVSTAADGRAALNMLNSAGAPIPCLILADLMMPVLDAGGMALELRATPKLASIPVVVLSAKPPSRSRAMPIGTRAWVTKPVPLDALLAIVDNHCAAQGAAQGAGQA